MSNFVVLCERASQSRGVALGGGYTGLLKGMISWRENREVK